MPVYSKLLSAVALVALVVSGGAVNMNLRSNVARSAPFEDVGTMAGRTVPVPDERRPAPKPDERRQPKPDERRQPKPDERRQPKPDERRQPKPDERRQPKPDERRQPKPDERRQPKPEERRRPEPAKDTRRREPVVKETRRPEPAKKGPTGAEIYQNKITCNKGCKKEFGIKNKSCDKGRNGKACRNSNKANKQACLDDCKA